MKAASGIGASLVLSFCLLPALSQESAPDPKPAPEKKADQQGTNQEPAPLTEAQAQAAVQDLASGDWQAREAATSKLIDGGEEAVAALEQGLLSSDPEVRLRCLYVLRRADVLSEQLLNTMLEKSTTDESLEAVYALRKDRKSFRRAILKRVPELARNKSDRRQMQLLTITIDMVREVARPEDADEVASFLALDLRDAHGFGSPLSILVEALARLPREAVMGRARAIAAERAAEAEAYPRTQALAAIAALGGASELPVIRSALASPGQSIRSAALEALWRVARNAEDAALAIPQLSAKDEDLVSQALQICREFSVAAAIPDVLKVLERDSESLQEEALGALAFIEGGDEVQSAALISALKLFLWPKLPVAPQERSARLATLASNRRFAAMGLARRKAISAAELIALASANEGLERAACQSLALLGDEASLAFLQRAAKGDEREAVQASALEALGLVKAPTISQFLADLVRDRDFVDPFARLAVLALRDQGTPVARAKLVELLELGASRRNVLSTIYDAIAELCIREAAPTLIKHLQSPSLASIARNDLLTALGNIGGADAINAIKQAAKLARGDADRTEFAWALARAGDRSMMPAIVKKVRNQLNGSAGSPGLNSLGINLLYAHDWDLSDLTFRRMGWTNLDAQVSFYNLACMHGLKNEPEAAFRLLDRCLEDGAGYWTREWRHFSTDPDLSCLRPLPKYQRLCERLRWASLLGE